MKNFTKILCVVLALVMALSVASCSLSPEYAYDKDDIKLPIGVYIYYLYNAYSQAQSYAQASDLYDSATGKYDGKKSFLKMEITDDDGVTAVAEDWIKNKAEEQIKTAVATMTKFNELGCTLDQTELDQAKEYYKSYWDQGYKETLEGYGISFDSFFMAGYTISVMDNDAFKAEYGKGGPSEVADADLQKYFTDNYTSYKYFSANLYKSETAEDTEASESSANVPLSEDEIAAYQKEFDGYASTLSTGGSFDDILKQYQTAHDITEDPSTQNVSIIEEDTTDELMKTIKDMKDGQAMTIVIGDDDTSKQIYLLYREPITNKVEEYTEADSTNRDNVLSSMKGDDFKELIKKLSEDLGVTLSSACSSYKPSMFEAKNKRS